jgi:SAM-dependent methyltransferase
MNQPTDASAQWGDGEAYERYVGRWSRAVAPLFLRWLSVPPGARWADVGCGTGALSQAVLQHAAPAAIHAIDKSPGFLTVAQRAVTDPRVLFEPADAAALPMEDGAFDATVSALVLNFLPQPATMVAEMARVTRPGGWVAAYVWDYAGGMQMMQRFWDAAAATEPDGRVDATERFPVCAPNPLRALWTGAKLQQVEVQALQIPTVFTGFDDFWQPFLGGAGVAPAWLRGASESRRSAIREWLVRTLPAGPDGSIALTARAWAVRGKRAGG